MDDNSYCLAVQPPPDRWEFLEHLVLDGLASPHSKRSYSRAIKNFVTWYECQPRPPFSRAVVLAYKTHLETRGLSGSSINIALAALRRLAAEACDNGLLSQEIAGGIARVKGAKRLGIRVGNWLSLTQAQALLNAPDVKTVKGLRDRAILAVLLGCAIRRAECSALQLEDVQQRDGRWVIVDMVGKGGRVRSVPVPCWVKVAIDAWTSAAAIAGGRVFGFSEKLPWQRLRKYARAVGLPETLAPHDLRRTSAKLCRAAGGELEQIQFLLGHASIQTTERYLGCRQDLAHAPNDAIQLKLES